MFNYLFLELSWILGRKPELDPNFLLKLKNWLSQVGIESERYYPTNQHNCLRRRV